LPVFAQIEISDYLPLVARITNCAPLPVEFASRHCRNTVSMTMVICLTTAPQLLLSLSQIRLAQSWEVAYGRRSL
jgi:hypothetical protein